MCSSSSYEEESDEVDGPTSFIPADCGTNWREMEGAADGAGEKGTLGCTDDFVVTVEGCKYR